jgi:hypothetical protein
MNKKLTKTFIKQCNVYFWVVKTLVNGYLKKYLNDISYQILNMNLSKIIWKFLKQF